MTRYEYQHSTVELPIRCPHCKSDNYTCEESGPDDDNFYEDYICDDCGTVFKVWYVLKYVETVWTTKEEQDKEDARYREQNREYIDMHNKNLIEDARNKILKQGDKLTNEQANLLLNMLHDIDNRDIFSSTGCFNSWLFENKINNAVKMNAARNPRQDDEDDLWVPF